MRNLAIGVLFGLLILSQCMSREAQFPFPWLISPGGGVDPIVIGIERR